MSPPLWDPAPCSQTPRPPCRWNRMGTAQYSTEWKQHSMDWRQCTSLVWIYTPPHIIPFTHMKLIYIYCISMHCRYHILILNYKMYSPNINSHTTFSFEKMLISTCRYMNRNIYIHLYVAVPSRKFHSHHYM